MEDITDRTHYRAKYAALNRVTGEMLKGKIDLNSRAPIQATNMLQSEIAKQLTCDLADASIMEIHLTLVQGRMA